MSQADTTSARYTREWLASKTTAPGTVDDEQAFTKDAAGLPTQLYSSCQKVLQDLCSQQCMEVQEERARLYLWGEGFRPGDLDKALEYSEDLSCVVLRAFKSIGKLLLREVSRPLDRSLCSVYLDAQAQELTQLVEQAESELAMRVEDGDNTDSDDGYESESSSDDEEMNNIVQRLKPQIGYLMQLGPTLQQNLLYARKACIEASCPPIVPFHLSNPAKIYVDLVREKFRSAPNDLVDRLGESNWQRHQIIRNQMLAIERRSEGQDVSTPENIPFYNDRDDRYSAFRPHTMFHDSGIGTSVPAHTQYAPSHTSFLSTNAEEGSLRVPAAPKALGAGQPFQCPFCGVTLRDVKNRVDWK